MEPRVPPKGPRLTRNDEKWDSVKADIYRLYITESKTLPTTMSEIEDLHGFKASERKWKDKLKEWNYSKKLSEEEMKIVVAKVDKRTREGKQTIVTHAGSSISKERIRNFKRRKTVRRSAAGSSDAQTPEHVTCGTPPFTGNESPHVGHTMETISEELETITITEREIQYTDEHLAAPSSSQHPERNGAVPDFDTSEAESSTANFASSRISLEAETDWTLVLDTVVEAITNEQSIVDQTLDEALNATILDAHNKTVLPNLLLDHAPQSQRETIMAALLELQEVSARIDTEELPDDLPLAVSTLSNAIERYENCGSKGTGAAVVCKLQSTLASLLGAQGRLQESASVYRLCLAGYEKEIGMSSIESIEVRSSLINNLTQLGNFDEAIALCTRALGYCRLESNKRGEMHCIFDRALIYQRMSRNIEAITELIFLLTKALKHEFTAVPILQLLQSIQELVLLFRSSLGKGTNVVSVLRRMIGIAEENPDHPDWDCEPFPPLFFKAMELAAWCSYLRDRSGSSPLRQPAERLFRVGITRLEQSSNTRGYTRAAVYYWYANHLNRQRYQINGASYLLSSWEVLVQCECTKEDLGFRILKKIKDIVPFLTSVKQTGKTAEADKIELLLARASKALPKDNSIKYTLQNPLEIESVDEDIREVSSMEYDAMTILSHSTNTTGKSTGSSGFGVTFSESEYLGYNVADLVGTQK